MSAENARARADRYLQTAALLLQEEDYESCVSRAYYAMFYVVRALLNRRGLTPKTHTGIHRLFNQHFVQSDQVSREAARVFQEAQNLRELAEYADDFVIAHDQAASIVREAISFVEDLERLLG